MTDTPPNPKRRRRLWLVVAGLLLFVVSVVGWWQWPRGDARFVGTWSMVNADGEQIGRLSLEYSGLGSVSQTPPGLPPVKRQHFLHWEVKEGILLYGNRPSDFDSLFGRLMKTVARVPGATFFPSVERFAVEDVTDHRILMRRLSSNTDGREQVSLKRLPE